MLTLTDEARVAIHSLTSAPDAPADAGIRIAAVASSTDGAAPALTLSVAPSPQPGDAVMDEDGARVFLDSTAAQTLDGHTLDAELDTSARQISFFVA